jgi:hypothetical protein
MARCDDAMKNRLLAAVVALATFAITTRVAAQPMYGSTNNRVAGAVGAVGIVDQTTGAFSFIGDPTPGNDVLAGIDFNSVGQLFGVDNPSGSANPSVLIRINPSTGVLDAAIGTVTDSVSTNGVRIVDLAFQPGTDVLFGISQDALLYRINTATAVATLVGATGLGSFSLGLAFAPNGTLYATSGSTLAQLDPNTGLPLTTMAMTGPCIDGLAVRPSDGILFGTECDGSSVQRIDPTTGVATFIGPPNSADPDTADLAFFRPLASPVRAPAVSGRGLASLAALLLVCGVLLRRRRTRAV